MKDLAREILEDYTNAYSEIEVETLAKRLEEIRNETAKEILQELYNRSELVSEDGICTTMVTSSNIFDLAKQFNVNLEDEE